MQMPCKLHIISYLNAGYCVHELLHFNLIVRVIIQHFIYEYADYHVRIWYFNTNYHHPYKEVENKIT